MTFRPIAGCAALTLGLLLTWNVSPTAACEGTGCGVTTNAKPLNIMQFMREQAASTRVNERPQKSTRMGAKAHHAPPRAIAARQKPVRVPVEAAASFASQPAPNVQETPSNEPQVTDRTADANPAETTGAAMGSNPDVQLVDAEEYNEIDRKTGSAPAPSAKIVDNASSTSGQANNSWLRWIWSALGNTFAALAAAVHQLIHV